MWVFLIFLFSSLAYGAAEFSVKDGQIVFLHTLREEELSKIDTSTGAVNPYTAPNAFELAVSTTFNGVNADQARKLIKKEKPEAYLLKLVEEKVKLSSAQDNGLDVQGKLTEVNEKLKMAK